MELNISSETDPDICGYLVIKVACQIVSENMDFLTNGVGTTGKSFEKELKLDLYSYISE